MVYLGLWLNILTFRQVFSIISLSTFIFSQNKYNSQNNNNNNNNTFYQMMMDLHRMVCITYACSWLYSGASRLAVPAEDRKPTVVWALGHFRSESLGDGIHRCWDVWRKKRHLTSFTTAISSCRTSAWHSELVGSRFRRSLEATGSPSQLRHRRAHTNSLNRTASTTETPVRSVHALARRSRASTPEAACHTNPEFCLSGQI